MNRPQLALLLSPLSDFALDGLRDVAANQLADVLVDRLDELVARARNDGLKMCRELCLEARVGKQIDPLQHLHRDLLGKRAPALVVVAGKRVTAQCRTAFSSKMKRRRTGRRWRCRRAGRA